MLSFWVVHENKSHGSMNGTTLNPFHWTNVGLVTPKVLIYKFNGNFFHYFWARWFKLTWERKKEANSFIQVLFVYFSIHSVIFLTCGIQKIYRPLPLTSKIKSAFTALRGFVHVCVFLVMFPGDNTCTVYIRLLLLFIFFISCLFTFIVNQHFWWNNSQVSK